MTITVKVSDLINKINELKNDDIEYVEISILEEYVFNGEVIPSSLHFEAYNGQGGGIDYEGIEEVKVSPDYKFD